MTMMPQPVRVIYRDGIAIAIYSCPGCRRPASVTVARPLFEDWDGVTPPRQAFPGLDEEEHETLASGRHPECAAQADVKELAMELDDPRLELATGPVRAAVSEVLRRAQDELGQGMSNGQLIAVFSTAWEAVIVALDAADSERETAQILADPATMSRLGEAEAEIEGNAGAVAEIVNATGGTAFYSLNGEAIVLVDHKGTAPLPEPGRVISVCGHGSPVSAPLGTWLPGYPA